METSLGHILTDDLQAPVISDEVHGYSGGIADPQKGTCARSCSPFLNVMLLTEEANTWDFVEQRYNPRAGKITDGNMSLPHPELIKSANEAPLGGEAPRKEGEPENGGHF